MTKWAHPALRVPRVDDGPGSGDWDTVTWSTDDIPVLLARPESYLQQVTADFAAPLDQMSFGALAYLSRYVPLLMAPNAPLRRAIRGALQRHARDAELAVELGCSVGADLRTLAEYADAVIGVDISIAGLRAAKLQLSGAPLPVLVRVEGRSFRSDDPVVLPAVDNVQVVVGSGMDIPLESGTAQIALAVNLLDTVSHPLALIAQMDRVLAPDGLLIVTSPFAWNEESTAPENALGGGTVPGWAQLGTAAGLVELLSGRLPLLPDLSYDILETADVPWSLREHARAITHYDVHVLVARKR